MKMSCATFWGPFTPILFSESVDEGGESVCLTPWITFGTRLLSTCALVSLSAHVIAINRVAALGYSEWVLFGSAIAFLLLTSTSLQYAMNSGQSKFLACAAAPIHYIASSLSLGAIFPMLDKLAAAFAPYAAGAKLDSRILFIVVRLMPPSLTALDFFLGARLRFRVVYMILPQLVLIPYTVYFLVMHNLFWLSAVFLHSSVLAASIAFILVSRITDFCSMPRHDDNYLV